MRSTLVDKRHLATTQAGYCPTFITVQVTFFEGVLAYTRVLVLCRGNHSRATHRPAT